MGYPVVESIGDFQLPRFSMTGDYPAWKTIGKWRFSWENHRKMEVYPTWLWKNSLRTGKLP